MKFKVCGLFNEENIYKVAELNPDYVGHIFWEKSVRYLKSISPNLKKEIKKTGVFFNSKKDDVFNRINENNLACVQLHGDESPQYCKNIMDSGTQVIKSFRIDDDFDFSVLKNYENYCDLFLFDSKSELPGGTGKSFNWENLKKYKLKKEFFISGGIGLHSIESLIDLFKMDLPIYGVDVNSKFEDEKYLKKTDELKTFIETIKNEIYSR
tara:strand:+ start:4347 stop:4976 length:630 start_codon:yes stop_codon:yes gene_type:complete